MEIDTAENIFNTAVADTKEASKSAVPLLDIVKLAMKRHTEQYIDLAASYVDANKEQILNIKNQIK